MNKTATDFHISDASDRQNAVTHLNQNMIVVAGAGTGKTTLLVDRLALLIVGKGIPVEKIVALTFTKKAAEEMRVRLEEMLRDVLIYLETDKIPEVSGSLVISSLIELYRSERLHWKPRVQKALEDIPKAQLGTIHSFAAYLLRLYPLQSHVDPAFREDEGEIFNDAFDEAWAGWLADELKENSARQREWTELLTRLHLSELRDLAHELCSAKVALKNLNSTPDLREPAKIWAAELQKLLSDNPVASRGQKFPLHVDAMQRVFASFENKKQLSTDDKLLLQEDVDVPAKWEKIPGVEEKFKRLHRVARDLTSVDDSLIDKALFILQPFVAQFKKDLDQKGVVSFDGLLVLARNLVRDHPDVRRALKKQFDTFLIDEFQDTDPLQGEILFYLAENPEREATQWEQVSLSPGRLFVVGDPKQSIYRFRGADMAAFEAFQNLMIKQGAEQASLTQNFRSAPPLIEFVNEVMPVAMKENSGLQPAYIPLQCGVEQTEPAHQPSYLRLDIESDGGRVGAEEARRLEGKAIADWIKNYSGPLSDVALLFRSTFAFLPYLDALRQASIPYLAEGEKLFYRTPEVLEFLNLLSVIHNQNDKLALVGVLRSPLGGLTDREIWDLQKINGLDLSREPSLYRDRLSGLFEKLRHLSHLSLELPVENLIDRIFADTYLLPLVSQSFQGEQALANLRKIRLLAEKWSEEGPLTLGSFLRRFKDYRDDEKEEGENPLADVNYEAVRVMTIHKAKGLEFPVVILPDLHRDKVRSSFKPRILETDWLTGQVGLRLRESKVTNSAMVLVENEILKREAAEEARVFYVALTRAKKQLRLHVRANESKGIFYSYLAASGHAPIPVDELRIKAGLVPRTDAVKSATKSSSTNPQQWLEFLAQRRADYQRVLGRRAILSPSSQLQEPEKKYISNDEETERLSDPIRLGLLCHKVLEEWDYKQIPSTKKIEQAVLKAGKLFELFPEDPFSHSVLEEGRVILSSYLESESARGFQKAQIIGREVPFLYSLDPKNNEGASLMRGVIDVLYEKDGNLIVADYKTTQVKQTTAPVIAKKYQVQADAYRHVLEKTFNRKVQFEIIFLRTSQSVFLS